LRARSEIKDGIGDRPWVVTLPLANAAEGKGLSKLWARRKIDDAEIARTMREATPSEADKTILALALEHQLVTRLTSLVAVDKTPSRPEGKRSNSPNCRSPAGRLGFAKVFGERPKPASPPVERRAEGDARVQFAAVKRPLPAVTAAPNTIKLPKTATDAELKMIAGSILAGARPDPVRVQPASDIRTLTPDERRSSPPLLLKARAASHPRPRRATSLIVIASEAKQSTGVAKEDWIASLRSQ